MNSVLRVLLAAVLDHPGDEVLRVSAAEPSDHPKFCSWCTVYGAGRQGIHVGAVQAYPTSAYLSSLSDFITLALP